MNMSDSVATGLDSTEVQELIDYVQGTSTDTPRALEKIMTNLYQKMTTVAGYTVAAEVQRQAKLTNFLAKLEDELFDEDTISSLSRDDLMDLHKRVSAESSASQEYTRKWLQQNRDTFTGKKTEMEKLAAQLTALPADKLSTIKKILNGETLEQEEVPEDL